MENQLAEIKQLLLTVLEENKKLREEIKAINDKIDTKKVKVSKPREERDQCSGLTAKGTQCKNKCIENNKCRMHLSQDTEQIQPKPKKEKKKKQEPPRHNHAPGEQPEMLCQLCESHGDILDPTLPDREFERIPLSVLQTASTSNAPIHWASSDDDDFFER